MSIVLAQSPSQTFGSPTLTKVEKRRRKKKAEQLALKRGLVPTSLTPKPPKGPRKTKSPGSFIMSATDLNMAAQNELQGVMDSLRGHPGREYLKTLILPSEAMARMPDAFTGATALVRSTMVFSVPCYFTGAGVDAGRFAFVVQPHLGSVGNLPTRSKVALVDPTWQTGTAPFSWPLDLTNPLCFVKEFKGRDIRIDPQFTTLTQPPLGTVSYVGANDGSTNPASPFGSYVTATDGYGLSAQYSVGSGSPAGSTFVLAAGFYSCLVTLLAPSATPGQNVISVVGSNGVTVVGPQYNVTSNTGQLSVCLFYVSFPVAGTGGPPCFLVYTNATTGTFTNATIRITQSYDDLSGITSNGGLLQKYRPVACSVLAKYVGGAFYDGGEITAGFLPGNATNQQFFTTSTGAGQGNISYWENLSGLLDDQNKHVGKLKTGAYAWYAPQSNLDYSFYTPDDAVAYNYPNIIVAGQWAPAQTLPTDGTNVLEVVVTSVYELQSDWSLLEKMHQPGSTAIMEDVLNMLSAQPHCMENPQHKGWAAEVWDKIVNGITTAGKFLWKNRRPIGTAIGSLLPLV